MKQQCHIAMVYAAWLFLLGGFIYLLSRGEVIQAVFWISIVAAFLWAGIRYFPSYSSFMGYGSVADRPAASVQPTDAEVVLYTGIGCPFCPLVKNRLQALQAKMGFRLREIDVTFKPGVPLARGIKALPVIEIGDRRRIGNGTSDELAAFIAASLQHRT